MESVPYSKILTTFADKTDKVLMSIGYLMSIITGVGLPSVVFFLADIVDEYGQAADIVKAILPISLKFIVVGLFIWVTSYLYYSFLVIMSERIGKKTRVEYLRSILK